MDFQRGIKFVLINFATPIVFYFAFHWVGPKAAIAFAVSVSLIQLIVHALYRIQPSPFFLVASGFTVVFGTIDLLIQDPRFFRFQPFFQNFLIASVLLISLGSKYPVMQVFAAALPQVIRPDLSSISAQTYLRRLTWVWVFYLYVKAGLFLYLAFQVDLASLVVLRSLIGGGTLVLMILGEILLRKRFL